MKRALAALLGVVALVTTGAGTGAAPATALGKVKCDRQTQPTVSLGRYDPIVNHNGTRPGHEHQYFGNIAWHSLANPNRANYGDLVGKANNCRNVLGLTYSADSAGYWTPTLRYKRGTARAGQLVPARQFTAYYRSYDARDFGVGQPFPPDTRLIATDDHGKGAHGWSCGEHSVQAAREGTVGRIPDCTGESGKPGHTLTSHITFPSCWDGVLPRHRATDVGNTSDNAHYAYPSRTGVCPAAFPRKVVQLRITVQFAYVGNGTDVELSSDAHAGFHDGETMHADFWNTWRQREFATYVSTCVNSTRWYTTSKCSP